MNHLLGGDLIIPDIIAVYNTSGTKLISYVYDAWGNVTVTNHNVSGTNSGARHNPFRYRGYYYDTETGYYYLQSRYYNPEWGRFISPDSFDIIGSTTDDLYDNNLYSYCDNNPVMRVDDGGEFWTIIGATVGAVVSGVVSIISQYATTGNVDWEIVGVNVATGAISGALASTGIGLVASVGLNAALGGGTYVAEQTIKGEKITIDGIIASTIAGGIGGVIGGSGANAKALSTAWKTASKGISREMRRANVKYATKQIAKYTSEKIIVKKSTKVAVTRLALGAAGNAFARWKFGY